MAIVKCGECGAEISDKAEACPKCGAPMRPKPAPPTQYGCGTLVLVLVIGFGVVALIQSITHRGTSGAVAPSCVPPTAERIAELDKAMKKLERGGLIEKMRDVPNLGLNVTVSQDFYDLKVDQKRALGSMLFERYLPCESGVRMVFFEDDRTGKNVASYSNAAGFSMD